MIGGMAAPARPIGAHAPVTGGLAAGVLKYAAQVKAEAVQVFVSNPRGWAVPASSDSQVRALRAHVEATGFPVFIHTPYLINLGSADQVVRERSASLLGYCLRRGADVAARGVVVHAGSATAGARATGLRRTREALLPLLDGLPEDGPDALIEPMAGQGNMLCATVRDIGRYLTALDWHPRAMLCLDTCHLFGAGHDLAADGGAAATLAELAQVAPGRLRLIHANDAQVECGSKRDRHRAIGEGTLGRAPFWDLLHHSDTAGVAFVVETPGGRAGHTQDIARLKRLRASSRPPARTAPRARSAVAVRNIAVSRATGHDASRLLSAGLVQ